MAPETIAERRLGREAVLAIRTVAEAVDLARRIERDVAAGALSKRDASPVTVADFSVQALIAARLGRDFPSDTLVAEEDASALRDAPKLATRVVDILRLANPALDLEQIRALIDRGRGSPGRRFWTLDPIDGTKGLLREGQYAVALALIEDGIVKLGVLGCPRLSLGERSLVTAAHGLLGEGGIAVAVRDRGAWWSGCSSGPLVRLSVSDVNEPQHARVLHSFETPHSDVKMLRHVVDALGLEHPLWLIDSQAKHAVVASGVADILLRFPTRWGFHDAIWDQAVGSLLVEEAGGRVTDLAGLSLDFSVGRHLSKNEGIVATNGVLHDSVVKAIQRAHAEPRI